MRPGNNNRRGRNRGPRKPHGGIPNKNQSFDGGGSETRVRGNVYQVLEKYLQLARDAGVSGDRIAAENYLQHADHYYRVIQSMNDGQRPRVGGRDISVADFNVQNVSQGLSAALYTGGQAPQANIAEPGSGGGAVAAPSSGGNSGSGGSAEFGDGSDREDSGQSGDDEGGDEVAQPGNRSGRHRSGNRQGNYGPNGQHARTQPGNPVQGNVAHGNQAGGAAAPSQAQAGSGDAGSGRPVEGTNGAQPAVRSVVDEQPDYPEDLLPPVAARTADDERGPRPRNRLRGRRPRPAGGDAGADAGAEIAAPTSEGGE